MSADASPAEENVFCSAALQNIRGFADPAGIVAMDGNQNPAVFHAPLIALGFVFGIPMPDERTNEAARSRGNAESREGTHHGARRDE